VRFKLSIPSFEYIRNKGSVLKPRIHVLAVKDKNKLDEPVIAYIIVERSENIKDYQEQGQIYEASICLDYQIISVGRKSFRMGGSFCGGYSKFRNRVSLSHAGVSEGAIFLDLNGLEGQRIGSYLMNEIVSWVKKWPDAEVNPIRLSSCQATPENKERRNNFYENFGLEFDYADSDKKEGRSKIMKAGDLKENLKWQENIEVVEFIPFVEELMSKVNKQKLDLDMRESSIKRLSKENQLARDCPIRWGLKWTWYNNRYNLFALSIVGLLGFLAWFRF